MKNDLQFRNHQLVLSPRRSVPKTLPPPSITRWASTCILSCAIPWVGRCRYAPGHRSFRCSAAEARVAWGVEITNPDDGSREEMLLLSIGYYVLPGGVTIRAFEQPPWCRDCSKFVRAEHLSDVEDIDAQVAKYSGKAADVRMQLAAWLFRLGLGLRSRQHLLHELSVWEEAVAEELVRREWRLTRQSAPRCLSCGSTALDLPSDGDFPHPSGNGRVRVEITSHLSLATDENKYYTSDGLR